MYDLKKIYRRLRENYAGYDIACEDGILSIAMPWGNAVAKGLDFSFWAEGKPIDKGRAENEEELYGILERFILRSLPGMKAADPRNSRAAGFFPWLIKTLCGVCCLLGYAFLILLIVTLLLAELESGVPRRLLSSVFLFASGILLLPLGVSRTPYMLSRLQISAVYRENYWIAFLGALSFLLGMFILMVAAGLEMDEAEKSVYILLSGLLGLGFQFAGEWGMLAGLNRAVYLEEDKSFLYVNSWGRMRHLPAGLTAAVELNRWGCLKFFDWRGVKLFSVLGSLPKAQPLLDSVRDSGLTFSIDSREERILDRARRAKAPIQWREEYGGTWHNHPGMLRLAAVLTALLLVLGCFLPLSLFYFGRLDFPGAVFFAGMAPLLFVLFYMVFASALLPWKKPERATAEWKAKHIRIPSLLLLPFSLLYLLQFIWVWNGTVMTVSDNGMFIFQWLCLSLLLVAAAVIRKPGRLRSFGLLILCVCFLLLGPGIVYGFNLAISGPAEHSPAEVVEYSWPIAGEENGAYSLTVRLDDGSRIELEVSERLYKLERSGQELELCQRSSPLGLRFVALHMPGRPGLGDGGL